MDFIGENFIKLDIEQIRSSSARLVELDDKSRHIHWAVIYSNELYYLYKREYDEYSNHESDGIALSDDIYEIIEEIKEFYEIETNEINEDIAKEDMKKILKFLNAALNIEPGYPMIADKGIERMLSQVKED